MPQVKDITKKNRALELIDLSNKLASDYANKFIGMEVETIIERVNKEGFMEGHSSNYLDIIVEKDDEILMKNVLVKLIEVKKDKILGKVIKK